jgi:hypothetical protein
MLTVIVLLFLKVTRVEATAPGAVGTNVAAVDKERLWVVQL